MRKVLIQLHHDLETKLKQIRSLFNAKNYDDEEAILEEMDALWYRMTDEEHKILEMERQKQSEETKDETPDFYYVAVRHDGGRNKQWFDITTISRDIIVTRRNAEKDDRKMPGFSAEHKVIRFAKVKIVEEIQNS